MDMTSSGSIKTCADLRPKAQLSRPQPLRERATELLAGIEQALSESSAPEELAKALDAVFARTHNLYYSSPWSKCWCDAKEGKVFVALKHIASPTSEYDFVFHREKAMWVLQNIEFGWMFRDYQACRLAYEIADGWNWT